MTIVVSVQCSEGIVLAADSASAVASGALGVRVWTHAKKLSHLRDYNLGTLTWGLGALGHRNIQSLMYEFERDPTVSLGEKSTCRVHDVATKLHSFLLPRYREVAEEMAREEGQPVDPLGMIVAGYSHGSFTPEQYRFLLPDDPAPERIDFREAMVGMLFEGLPDAIHRLIHGLDPRIAHALSSMEFTPEQLARLAGGLTDAGFLEEYATAFAQTVAPAVDRASRFINWLDLAKHQLVIPGMPLQDGIDLAIWLIEATIGRYRFGFPWPIAAGEIDIAVITHSDFTWIRRKAWHAYSRQPAYFGGGAK